MTGATSRVQVGRIAPPSRALHPTTNPESTHANVSHANALARVRPAKLTPELYAAARELRDLSTRSSDRGLRRPVLGPVGAQHRVRRWIVPGRAGGEPVLGRVPQVEDELQGDLRDDLGIAEGPERHLAALVHDEETHARRLPVEPHLVEPVGSREARVDEVATGGRLGERVVAFGDGVVAGPGGHVDGMALLDESFGGGCGGLFEIAPAGENDERR